MEITKLGRCECRTDHPYNFDLPTPLYHAREKYSCRAEATRLVIIPKGSELSRIFGGIEQVPMCAACADFHENGGAK